MKNQSACLITLVLAIAACTSLWVTTASLADPPKVYVRFNGVDSRIDVPSSSQLSLSSTGLTIAVWMRPDSLTFPKTEGSLPSQQYVYWLGKGDDAQQEWTFRMYSLTQPGPRQNRISFYVFKAAGGRGCGSYFQDPIKAGEWLQVVGVIDPNTSQTSIYKNGELRHSDSYASLTPRPQGGSAPMRIGTKDLGSFFQGAIGTIRMWNRPLSAEEIQALYARDKVPDNGLVAEYLMNEGAGLTIHDSVGGHNGTISGAEWGQSAGQVGTGIGHAGGGC